MKERECWIHTSYPALHYLALKSNTLSWVLMLLTVLVRLIDSDPHNGQRRRSYLDFSPFASSQAFLPNLGAHPFQASYDEVSSVGGATLIKLNNSVKEVLHLLPFRDHIDTSKMNKDSYYNFRLVTRLHREMAREI